MNVVVRKKDKVIEKKGMESMEIWIAETALRKQEQRKRHTHKTKNKKEERRS